MVQKIADTVEAKKTNLLGRTRFCAAVEESVAKAKRVSDPHGPLSHCFNAGNVPEVTVHFNGVAVRLSPIDAFVKVSEDMVCLSMISTNDIEIYGTLLKSIFSLGMT